jgi:hypothetical protein
VANLWAFTGTTLLPLLGPQLRSLDVSRTSFPLTSPQRPDLTVLTALTHLAAAAVFKGPGVRNPASRGAATILEQLLRQCTLLQRLDLASNGRLPEVLRQEEAAGCRGGPLAQLTHLDLSGCEDLSLSFLEPQMMQRLQVRRWARAGGGRWVHG